jgi:hypothetical protein
MKWLKIKWKRKPTLAERIIALEDRIAVIEDLLQHTLTQLRTLAQARTESIPDEDARAREKERDERLAVLLSESRLPPW